jgi:putative sterol carrier protein
MGTPVFNTTEEFYDIFERLFTQIAEADPQVTGAVSSAHLIIRLTCSSPSGVITINGRVNPPKVMYGKSPLRPDLEAEMACDVLHQILMGTLPLGKAFGNGQMKVRGAMLKSFVLADIFRKGQSIYPQIMQEKDSSA